MTRAEYLQRLEAIGGLAGALRRGTIEPVGEGEPYLEVMLDGLLDSVGAPAVPPTSPPARGLPPGVIDLRARKRRRPG